jgi:hypothetical protein
MTLNKSLLCVASALALGAGPAFAGEDSTVDGSVETSPPEQLSEESFEPMDSSAELESYEGVSMEEYEVEEYEVVYLVPMEVTEYYYAWPKSPDEMPG